MGTRIALHVRDVGGLDICIMGGSIICFCTRNLRAMNPSTLLAVCAAFLCLFLPPEVFGDIVALHVVVSDVHHRTFINIVIHLPLVCPLNKFIDIFL